MDTFKKKDWTLLKREFGKIKYKEFLSHIMFTKLQLLSLLKQYAENHEI